MKCLSFLVLLALLFPGATAAANDGAIEVEARRLLLDPEYPERNRIGDLVWRGGLELTSKDKRFGGFSGMLLDGDYLTAITDKGHWMAAQLNEDADGLKGLSAASITRYRGRDGKPLESTKFWDAESLVQLPDGSFLVGFEGKHRIWRYPASSAGSPLDQTAQVFQAPDGLKRAPVNGGLEAIVLLSDGRLMALAEDFTAVNDPEGKAGFLWDGDAWAELSYRTEAGFKPTAATLLPDGDLLVLERRFSLIGGLAIRLVRVESGRIGPGAVLKGKVLASFTPPMAIDNMEAMAVRRGPKGETLIYLLSDDNFNPLQRTLLLRFELDPEGS